MIQLLKNFGNSKTKMLYDRQMFRFIMILGQVRGGGFSLSHPLFCKPKFSSSIPWRKILNMPLTRTIIVQGRWTNTVKVYGLFFCVCSLVLFPQVKKVTKATVHFTLPHWKVLPFSCRYSKKTLHVLVLISRSTHANIHARAARTHNSSAQGRRRLHEYYNCSRDGPVSGDGSGVNICLPASTYTQMKLYGRKPTKKIHRRAPFCFAVVLQRFFRDFSGTTFPNVAVRVGNNTKSTATQNVRPS